MYEKSKAKGTTICGQSEIVIVLSIAVVAVIAIYFVSQVNLTGQKTYGAAELKQLFKAEMEGRFADLAAVQIREITANGGYINSPRQSVPFHGTDVAYWQICQNTFIPSLDDITRRIKNSIEDEVNKLPLTDFQGKPVSKEAVREVSVSLGNDNIVVEINAPTKLSGFEIEQPYKISIQTKLKRAYEFASDFVKNNSAERHIERSFVSLLYRSRDIPTIGLQTKCGDAIIKTLDDLKKPVEDVMDIALSNIVLWSLPKSADEFKYYLPDLSGKKYGDLAINFFRASEVNRANFFVPNNLISIINAHIIAPFVAECVNDYDVQYSADLPVVVDTGSLRFAVNNNIKDNEIGLCSSPENFAEQANICDQAKCSVEINVVDTKNQPVDGATVTFGACLVGKTGSSGFVSGRIPCGLSELVVSHPNYNHYSEVSSLQANKTVVLKKAPKLFVSFNAAPISSGLSSTKPYVNQYVIGSPYFTSMYNDPVLGPLLRIINPKNYSSANMAPIYALLRPKNPKPWNNQTYIITNVAENMTVPYLSSTIVDDIEAGNYSVQISTLTSTLFSVLFCTSVNKQALGPNAGECKSEDTITKTLPLTGIVDADFEVKESDSDIYITALQPNILVTDKPEPEYNYKMDSVMQCLDPMSYTAPQDRSCTIPL